MSSANILSAAIIITLFSFSAASAEEEGSNLGNVKGGDFHAARGIISTKCTPCHTDQVIDAALSQDKDMIKIQQEMEKRGAKLDNNEREVLGIYWKQNPLKRKK
jgi:uncharacterized membrane protein